MGKDEKGHKGWGSFSATDSNTFISVVVDHERFRDVFVMTKANMDGAPRGRKGRQRESSHDQQSGADSERGEEDAEGQQEAEAKRPAKKKKDRNKRIAKNN